MSSRNSGKTLLQSQVESAMKVTRSNQAAARYLRVSPTTYKKYASLYKDSKGISLYEKHKNQSGDGLIKMRQTRVRDKSKYKLDNILLGKHPEYPADRLLIRLIANGYKPEQCEHCGYREKRITDGRMPLILNHQDGDTTNHRLENLEVLCYNCYFTLIGNITPLQMKRNLATWDKHMPYINETGGLHNARPFGGKPAEEEEEDGPKEIIFSEEDKRQIMEELKNFSI